jgi:hypothetical protein
MVQLQAVTQLCQVLLDDADLVGQRAGQGADRPVAAEQDPVRPERFEEHVEVGPVRGQVLRRTPGVVVVGGRVEHVVHRRQLDEDVGPPGQHAHVVHPVRVGLRALGAAQVIDDHAQVGDRRGQLVDLVLGVQIAAADEIQGHAAFAEQAQLRDLGGVDGQGGAPEKSADADHAWVARDLIELGFEVGRADLELRDHEREKVVARDLIQHPLRVAVQVARFDDSRSDDAEGARGGFVGGGQDVAVELGVGRGPGHAARPTDLEDVNVGVQDRPGQGQDRQRL